MLHIKNSNLIKYAFNIYNFFYDNNNNNNNKTYFKVMFIVKLIFILSFKNCRLVHTLSLQQLLHNSLTLFNTNFIFKKINCFKMDTIIDRNAPKSRHFEPYASNGGYVRTKIVCVNLVHRFKCFIIYLFSKSVLKILEISGYS